MKGATDVLHPIPSHAIARPVRSDLIAVKQSGDLNRDADAVEDILSTLPELPPDDNAEFMSDDDALDNVDVDPDLSFPDVPDNTFEDSVTREAVRN